MSGRERPSGQISSTLGKIKDKLSKNDEKREPALLGYQRVQGGNSSAGGGTLSTSTTGTSLDLMIVDDTAQTFPISHPSRINTTFATSGGAYQSIDDSQRFTPIFEGDDFNDPPIEFIQTQQQLQKNQQFRQPLTSTGSAVGSGLSIEQKPQQKTSSKQSLKGSRVSFEKKEDDSTDEDSFEDKRDQFQQQRTISGVDPKGILKDLKHILANDNRKAFQSKKHVSLDVKGTFLEDLLKESSSEEDFRKTRKEFQGRKHQSLDPRVNFKLEKALLGQSSTSSDEEGDDQKSLIQREKRYKDRTKPIIVDLKDFDSEDEDFIAARKSFQQQRQVSMESKKSLRFFEMDEIGSKKNENLRNAVPFVRQITEDGKPKLEVYRPTTNPIYIWTQLVAALTVSLGSMVVGYSSAYTSPALDSMKDRNITSFVVSEQEQSWIGGLMPLAGLAGGMAGGPLIEYIGRKNTILATACPFILSWLLIGFADSVVQIFVGRALAGLCVGIASLSLPVYLAETIQPEVRGILGLLPTAFGNIGILVCFIAGSFLNWFNLAFLGAALPVPFLILMFLIPETPRWFISRGKEERARKALIWLRGGEADVEPELKSIVRSHTDAERHSSGNAMLELLKRSNLKPLLISLGLMFFQQMSGINAVIFYTTKIFEESGSTIDKRYCTIIVGVVNFIATFIATGLIDRLGRKILLYISNVTMIFTLFTLATYFYCRNSGMEVSHVGWLPLASCVLYVLGFSLGFGPIPWLMMGEILPGKIRGAAASVATSFNWAFTFLVTKTFQDLIDSIGIAGTFYLFGTMCVIGLFFVIFYVPETQGKSLEEIERKMMGRVRRMSSVANMKPLSFNM